MSMFYKTFKHLWEWKMSLIKRYPIWCCYAAWLEGILIGVLIMWWWF